MTTVQCKTCYDSWGEPDLCTCFGPIIKSLGIKGDYGKHPMHLIPPELLTAVASVLDFGAKKYEARNWEKGLEYSRVFSALQRHMWSWWAGIDNDDETGMSHLWHAACCIAFLVAFDARGAGSDDRPKK